MPPRRQMYTQAQVDQLVADALIAEQRRSETPPNTTVVKPCTYKDFLSCKPLNFNGTEGAIGLLRWLEKTESVFRICNCSEDCKVKFSTYTFMDDALTWWNTYADSVGQDIALQTPWDELKKMLKDEYCPRDEIQQLEAEFWQLTTQGNDIAGYTSRFNQLAHLCPSMVNEEYKRIERYIWGLPPQIQGMVTSSNSPTFHDNVRMAHKLMAQMVRQGTAVDKNASNNSGDSKRKADGNPGNQNQANKKPATAKTNTSESDDKIGYKGSKPYCSKCSHHHDGSCPCTKCKRFGHMAKDCKAVITSTNTSTPKTCYECNGTGHFRKDCPKLKDKNSNTAKGRVYVLNTAGNHQNPRLIDLLNTGKFIYKIFPDCLYTIYFGRPYLLLNIFYVLPRF